MLPDSLFTWILAGAVCLLIGKEIGKWLPSLPSLKSIRASALERRRDAAKKLAAELRATGLQLVTDVQDSLDRIQEVAAVVKEGNDAILKCLEDTYQRIKGGSQAPSPSPSSSPSPAQ
jgi:hypothetical protein